MWQTKLARNSLVLLGVQASNYLLPLLIVPLLLQRVGAPGYGVLSFATVVMGYLAVLAEYGFNLSATRAVAQIRQNFAALAELYTSVQIARFGLAITGIPLLGLLLWLQTDLRPYWLVFVAMYSVVLGQALFPIWLFQGLEQMRYVTLVHVVPKVVCAILLIVLVNGPGDLLIAAVLTGAGFLLSGIFGVLICYYHLGLHIRRPAVTVIWYHMREGWPVFVAQALALVIAGSGTVVLWQYASAAVVGYYAATERMVRAGISFFNPVLQSLFPHVSGLFQTDYANARRIVRKVGLAVLAVAIAGMLVIQFTASWLLVLLTGSTEAANSLVPVLRVLSVWMVLAVLNNLVGIQFLIGSGQGRLYSHLFMVAAALTLILYLILAPNGLGLGVSIAILGGEGCLTVMMFTAIRIRRL